MNILNKSFQYTPAAKTDIGKRFRRILREQEAARKAAAERDQANADEARRIVVAEIPRARGKS